MKGINRAEHALARYVAIAPPEKGAYGTEYYVAIDGIHRKRENMKDALWYIAEKLRRFTEERDWDKFHSPKNLAMAMTVEVAELLEHFQWLTEDQSKDLPIEKRALVAEEIADIQIYLIRMAEKLGIDILDSVRSKIKQNEKKYPADRVRGDARKYNEYHDRQGNQ